MFFYSVFNRILIKSACCNWFNVFWVFFFFFFLNNSQLLSLWVLTGWLFCPIWCWLEHLPTFSWVPGFSLLGPLHMASLFRSVVSGRFFSSVSFSSIWVFLGGCGVVFWLACFMGSSFVERTQSFVPTLPHYWDFVGLTTVVSFNMFLRFLSCKFCQLELNPEVYSDLSWSLVQLASRRRWYSLTSLLVMSATTRDHHLDLLFHWRLQNSDALIPSFTVYF